jgi:pilus assembly protein CpaE
MGQRVLVVDDDIDTLNLIGLTLKRYGFEVAKALSGQEALDLLNHDMPDLMILDVMMPQMDGYEVCRLIRADPRLARLPVVMLTARSQMESQVEAFRAGADDYITKPVRTTELIARLQAVMEHSIGPFEQKSARVISVLGAKGGVGGTTLAVNLALALAAQTRTILADLEVGGMAAMHLGLDPDRGLRDLLVREVDDLDLASVEAALTSHSSGLRLLAAADELIDPLRAGAVLNRLLSLCDVCLFDLGAGLSQTARALAQRSNDFVLALDSDRITLTQAQRVVHSLSEAKLPQDVLKLVWVNRLGTPVDTAQAAIRAVLGHDPTTIIEPAAQELYHALECSQPLVISQPDHPAALRMRALADLLMSA